MRVIAGTYKGRRLQAVKGQSTRPTTDQVKEALFNRIGPYFEGGRGLDLFSGSGGLGIEALSRGLEHMIFVDSNTQAVRTVRANLKTMPLADQTEVYRNDVSKALNILHKRELSFDLIFMDPPYFDDHLVDLIEKIAALQILRKDGILVVEHHVRQSLPSSFKYLERRNQNVYSHRTVLSLYENI